VAVIAIRPEVMLFVTFMTYALLGAIFGVWRIGRPPKMVVRNSSHASHSLLEADDDEEDVH